MPIFSRRSKMLLGTCDIRLQHVFDVVIQEYDCSIISGLRKQEEQNELVRTGRSKLKYPNSLHNKEPSMAIDAAPYPIDWKDRERATLFAGFVLGVAYKMGVPLRWGGDWDGDWETRDNVFDDLWHFELIDQEV